MTRHKKVEYVACECGFRKENTQDGGPYIGAGDYCPRCGDRLTEYNVLHRQHAGRVGARGTHGLYRP